MLIRYSRGDAQVAVGYVSTELRWGVWAAERQAGVIFACWCYLG